MPASSSQVPSELMPLQASESFDWRKLTPPRIRVLAGLEAQLSEREIAEKCFVALSTIRVMSKISRISRVAGMCAIWGGGGVDADMSG